MKLYNIGLAKTGTTSIAQIFGNFRSRHEFQFEKTGAEDIGAGGIGRLFIDDQQAGEGEVPRTMGVRLQLADDGLCCGYDGQTPVCNDYQSPFRFNGKLKRVIVNVMGERYYNPELEYGNAMARQ